MIWIRIVGHVIIFSHLTINSDITFDDVTSTLEAIAVVQNTRFSMN